MNTATEPIKDKNPPIDKGGSHKLFEFRCYLCGDTADHTCLSCGKHVCMSCWNEEQFGCIECFPQFTDEAYAPTFQSHFLDN